MKKNKLIALFAGLSLAFVGSAALAAPSPDTLLVAGYDNDAMAVLYGVSGIDQPGDEAATLDCTLDGDFTYTIGEVVEGVADVVTLEGDETDDTKFTAETAVTAPGPDAISYDDLVDSTDETDRDCLLRSVEIEPNGNGEINHGKVVSTFAHLLKGGNGCLIRLFAQSDFGKGDYGELDPETATTDAVEEALEVTLASFETACAKGKDKKVDDDSTSGNNGHGKDKAPGQLKEKSNKGKDSAPGQKKAKGDDSSSG